jgi:hypothetical protein
LNLGSGPQLPAFRHLTPEQYQDRVAELIHEIEEEGKEQRNGDGVAGVEKILSQNPYEPPTRRTKRSTKPLFHVASKQARVDLQAELAAFLAQYWEASAALRGGNLKAASWFPDGCYPPALTFTGPPAPARQPSPPTRRIEILESGDVERGEIPVVEIPVAVWSAGTPARARGQPP